MEVCMIICHYNDRHLPYAIASLKRQSRSSYIILVDDGSCPEFKKACIRAENVKIIETRQNKGIGYARRVGLSCALQGECEFIGFLDSDGIAHPLFVEEAVKLLNNNNRLLGISAKKGLANQNIRIAKVKYHYKVYKKDDFQLDCSLFKREAFEKHVIPNRRAGEDSIFILSFEPRELAKLDRPYYHFERESVKDFLRDEYYGAYHGHKSDPLRILKQLFLTPVTSLKMIMRNRWIPEGLLFPLRQLVWIIGYLMGSDI